MKNIKQILFFTMIIIISVLNVKRCLPNEKRIGHIKLINGGGLTKLSHFVGFSCIVYVDQQFNFVIEIDQTSYQNIKECMHIRLVDAPSQNMYEFDPFIASENKEGQLIHSTLNLRYQNIKQDRLENTLKHAQKETLCLCIVEEKDLHVGINGHIYIFKNISFINGLRIDENHLKAALPTLLSGDFNETDFKLQAQHAQEKQEYLQQFLINENLQRVIYATEQEKSFLKCLSDNKKSPNISAFGIPEVCENYAITLNGLDRGDKVNLIVAGFQKIMNPKSVLEKELFN